MYEEHFLSLYIVLYFDSLPSSSEQTDTRTGRALSAHPLVSSLKCFHKGLQRLCLLDFKCALEVGLVRPIGFLPILVPVAA